MIKVKILNFENLSTFKNKLTNCKGAKNIKMKLYITEK